VFLPELKVAKQEHLSVAPHGEFHWLLIFASPRLRQRRNPPEILNQTGVTNPASQIHPNLGSLAGRETFQPADVHTSLGRMADTDEVDEEIRAGRRALNEMLQDHHDMATCLDSLGVALGDRYSITGDEVDLEEAIRFSKEAVNITPLDSPDRAGRLSNYGIRLADKYSMSEEITDLEDAICIMRQVLDITPSDDPDRSMYLNNIGTALGDRYLQTNRMADLEESIQITQKAIDSAIDDYSDRPMYLNNLALRLGDRYIRTGEVADLENALAVVREAISLTSEDSPDRVLFLNTLGIQLGHQYLRTGAIPDLKESIRVAQETVDATPQYNPDRPMYLNNLGLALGDLYSISNTNSDVENAMLALQEALDLTPKDSPSRASYLNSLGIQFGHRYSKTGVVSDLEESIRLTKEAVRLTARDHPDRAGWLNNLGVRLGESYLRTDTTADLDEAIRVTQEAVSTTQQITDKVTYLCNLGNRLGERYLRTEVTADINNAIENIRLAISIAPADNMKRAMCLGSLGNRLGDRYDVEGTMAYLEESINILQQAVDITPENHPDKASYLNNLGVRLAARYTSINAISDLESTIQVTRRAIKMTPQSNQTKALFLHNLGATLGDRYTRLNTMADLEESIQVARESVNMTPSNHPSRAMYLNGLAIRLGDRYSRGDTMSDLNEIIQVASEAVNTIPDIHAKRPAYLNNLGIWLLERYERVKAMTDLDEAIRILLEAVDTTPESHSHKATYLINLGTGLDHKYLATGSAEHHETALSRFQSALREPNSQTIDRIAAGIAILRICATTSDWQQACDAAEIAVHLIPKLTARSLENSDKQHLLSQVVGLASDAAAAALHAGRGPIVALEFLEQGRGVLATSLEEMRTDIIELQSRYPKLAKQFIHLRDELNQPVARSTFLSGEHGDSDQQPRASQRYDAGSKLDKLIADIQRQPGLEDFLAAPSEAEMRAAARGGPIVVVNTSEYRCDAILVEKHQIRSVTLPGLKSKDFEERTRNSDLGKTEILEWLWDTVTHPILDALGFTQHPLVDNWPRVWWVATGTMSKLPLHAAGYHGNGSAETVSVLDRVMSSYSSSIKAIIQSRRRRDRETTPLTPTRALLVAMEHTPEQTRLPFAVREIDVIRGLVKSMHLEPIEPRRHKKDIIVHLQQCKVFHFAGHGHTDSHDPSRSHLLLEDGKNDPLTVANILETNLREYSPFLAYLSACGTGRIKDKRFIDESIHLISACQLAGFRHVIGTLWEVNDELCVDMARITYEGMRDGAMTDESVCWGLHNATRQLRDRWLNMLIEAGRGNSSARKIDISLTKDETGGRNASEGDRRDDRLPRDVVPYNDETGPLLWVPYVHFGV
jgi:tetratricopeptide (TPR) repeat protein